MSRAAAALAIACLCAAAMAPAHASGWPVSLDDIWRALTGRKQTIDWERVDPRPRPPSAPASAPSAAASAPAPASCGPAKGPCHD